MRDRFATAMAILSLLPALLFSQPAPPGDTGAIAVSGDLVTVSYGGRTVFEGRFEGLPAGSAPLVQEFRRGEAVTRVLVLTAGRSGGALRLSGVVHGGPEAFPCEADRPDRGPAVVRHADGLGRNLRDRAVYDRGADWALSVDANPSVTVVPADPAVPPEAPRDFDLAAAGAEVVLRFRPAFYRLHRGLRFFEPWTYRVPARSVAGWVSWFAFLDRVTEADVVRTADVLAGRLKPFGYEVLQIDDGYQRANGLPELWLEPNAKFPRGLAFLARYIRDRGLTPGLWTNAAFDQGDFAAAHREWFVLAPDGTPARGNWVGLVVDGSKPAALDALVRPIYRGLRAMGWDYFKLDALRHLRYEGYNAFAGHFRRTGSDRTEAFRAYVRAVREEIGPAPFLLACWGLRPELVGLVDGCRIGTDGFSYAGLAQFNSFNNVVWRNDPDHVEILKDGWRSALVTSLTGSLLLLTDPPETYLTEAAEPARRAAPVPVTVPGQLYDVDPSRSAALDRVDEEVSGSGPRAFDAGLTPACDLYLLDVHRPFESWAVLARTGEGVGEVRFADLGLDPARERLVFEFWSKRLVGTFRGGFAPGPIDPRFASQAFCIRERAAGPQVAATSRHVTCGGPDLLDVRTEAGALRGRSRLVAGDPYDLYLTEPEGVRLGRPACRGAEIAAVERAGGLVRVRLLSGGGGEVEWTVPFSSK